MSSMLNLLGAADYIATYKDNPSAEKLDFNGPWENETFKCILSFYLEE